MSKLKELEAKTKVQAMTIVDKEEALFNCMILADGILTMLKSADYNAEANVAALAAGIRAIANESLSF